MKEKIYDKAKKLNLTIPMLKGTVKERYLALSSFKNNFIRLKDIKSLNVNLKTKEELCNVSIDQLESHFNLYAQNHKITKRGTKSLWQVLSLLYHFCKESFNGMCHPSMETMAFILDPTLEKIQSNDPPFIQKQKQTHISKLKMRISRGIHKLEKIGLIVIMPYYINEQHFKNRFKKNSCYAYAIKPISLAFNISINIKQIINRSSTLSVFIDSLLELAQNTVCFIIPYAQNLKGYSYSLHKKLKKMFLRKQVIL